MDFLKDKIITRFGVPAKITTDNAKALAPQNYPHSVSNTTLYYPTHQIIILRVMALLSLATRT
jgi:hypothetical protein